MGESKLAVREIYPGQENDITHAKTVQDGALQVALCANLGGKPGTVRKMGVYQLTGRKMCLYAAPSAY